MTRLDRRAEVTKRFPQRWRVLRSSILNLADRGELPRLHFGRSVRFAVGDVQALVEERRRSAAGAGNLHRLSPADRGELASQDVASRPAERLSPAGSP